MKRVLRQERLYCRYIRGRTPFVQALRVFSILMVCSGTASAQSDAETPLWAAYHNCIDLYVADVARHVESIEEGALLIFESLCQQSAHDLMNTVAARPMLEDRDWSARFDTARYVIQRETRLLIFQQRVR